MYTRYEDAIRRRERKAQSAYRESLFSVGRRDNSILTNCYPFDTVHPKRVYSYMSRVILPSKKTKKNKKNQIKKINYLYVWHVGPDSHAQILFPFTVWLFIGQLQFNITPY